MFTTSGNAAPDDQGNGQNTMLSSLSSTPSAAAERYVRRYVQREGHLGASTFTHPLQPRSAHVLDFEFGDAVEIFTSGTDATRMAEPAAVVGSLTCPRGQVLIRGNVDTFVIVLKPAALHQLFGLPALDFTNRDHAAHAAVGAAASELQQRLGNALSFQERVQIADRFILSWSLRAPSADSIEVAANEIIRSHGGCRIDSLVHHTGLSVRTFQRRFHQRIGVSAKLYARIVRFESALKTKAALPHMSWTAIAYEFGYHDQMHMIHDFQQLSEQAPNSILRQMRPVFAPQITSAVQQDPDHLLL